jgi:hypothetical protein
VPPSVWLAWFDNVQLEAAQFAEVVSIESEYGACTGFDGLGEGELIWKLLKLLQLLSLLAFRARTRQV